MNIPNLTGWRVEAAKAARYAQTSGDQAAALAADGEISAGAFAQVFEDIYSTEILPAHTAAWHAAASLLLRHGKPMAHLSFGDSRTIQSPFSTGLVACGERQDIGMDVVVPALRISIPSAHHGDKVSRGFMGGVNKARHARKEHLREAAAARVMAMLESEQKLFIAAGIASTNSQLLDAPRGEVREVYDNAKYRWAGDPGGRNATERLLEDPDLVCSIKPLTELTNVSNALSSYSLTKPVVHGARQPAGHNVDYAAELEAQLKNYREIQPQFDTVNDMIAGASEPLAEMDGFRRSHRAIVPGG